LRRHALYSRCLPFAYSPPAWNSLKTARMRSLMSTVTRSNELNSARLSSSCPFKLCVALICIALIMIRGLITPRRGLRYIMATLRKRDWGGGDRQLAAPRINERSAA
jgi:hypothetical protein